MQAPLFGFFEDTIRRRGKRKFFIWQQTSSQESEMETDLFAGVEE